MHLESFKQRVYHLFQDQLKHDQPFAIIFDDVVVQNETQLAQIPDFAAVYVSIID